MMPAAGSIAQLVEEESTVTRMARLQEVIQRKGGFCALYSDRGSHFWPAEGSRPSLAGCTVMVYQHLDGTLSLTHGPHPLGHRAQWVAIRPTKMPGRRAVEKTLPQPRRLLVN